MPTGDDGPSVGNLQFKQIIDGSRKFPDDSCAMIVNYFCFKSCLKFAVFVFFLSLCP